MPDGVSTTDSDHDSPIFSNLARDLVVAGPNVLWVADLTYINISGGLVYAALIMDAWSRRIVGCALGQRIDVRFALAALDAAVALRRPPVGCIHHSDCGSQYATEKYRDRLAKTGLVGSMGRRGNPYDNAKMESLMKKLKVEGVYPMAFEAAEDVVTAVPRYIDLYNTVSATSITYAARLAFSAKFQGINSSMRFWGWPSRMACRVAVR